MGGWSDDLGRALVGRIDYLKRMRDRVDAENAEAYTRHIQITDRALELWCAEVAMFTDALRDALADRLEAEYGDDAQPLADLLRANDFARVAYLK